MENRKRLGHVKGISSEDATITALVSTTEWDRMEERIAKGAWDLKNYLKNAVVLWAHDTKSLPIAKTISIQETDSGLEATMQFDKGSPRAMEIFRLYKEKFLNAFSVGFIPKAWDYEEIAPQRRGLVFTGAELFEYSGVPVPANPGALVPRELAESIEKTLGPGLFKEIGNNSNTLMVAGPEEPEKPSADGPVDSPPTDPEPPAPAASPDENLEKSLKYLIDLSKTAKASGIDKNKLVLVQQAISVLGEIVEANREGVSVELINKLKETIDAYAKTIEQMVPDSATLVQKVIAQINKALGEN